MRLRILSATKVGGLHVDAGETSDKFSDVEAAELIAAGKAEVVEAVKDAEQDAAGPADGEEEKEQANG